MKRLSVNFLRGGLVVAAALCMAASAQARLELVQWEHDNPVGLAGFRVYTSFNTTQFGPEAVVEIPIDEVDVDEQNVYSTTIAVADDQNVYVVVSAYDAAATESWFSGLGMFTIPDDDGDGYTNVEDVFPQDPREWFDTDADGVGDNADFFPNDPGRHSLALSPYRVNVGSQQAQLDGSGRIWTEDTGFYGPMNARAANESDAIAGTDFEALYQQSRSAPSDDGLHFSFPVAPDNDYVVRLHFSEPTHAAGERQFGITLEGEAVASGFDIRANAGAPDQALMIEYEVKVVDSELDISLTREETDAGPILMGIEVQSLYAEEEEMLTAPGKPFIVETW